jgi:hypothetical protein
LGATGWQAKQISSAETSGRRDMKSYLQLLIAVTIVGWVGAGMASETRVVINLEVVVLDYVKKGKAFPLREARLRTEHSRSLEMLYSIIAASEI